MNDFDRRPITPTLTNQGLGDYAYHLLAADPREGASTRAEPALIFPANDIPTHHEASLPHVVSQSLSGDVQEDKRPKRPMTAYNWFFKREREQLLAKLPVRESGAPKHSHGKLGFAPMARLISSKWKSIDPEARKEFDELAKADKERYHREKEEWMDRQRRREMVRNEMVHACFLPNQPVFPKLSMPMAMGSPSLFQLVAATSPMILQAAQLPSISFAADMGPPPSRQEPVSGIKALAMKLDDDCIDMLVSAFSE